MAFKIDFFNHFHFMETDFILYLLTVKCILSAQRVTETQEPHCKVQV